MDALTGQILEVDDLQNHGGTHRCFLADNYSGGGLLSELMTNAGTFKANVLTTNGNMESVSVAAHDFMSVGDTITVVRDDDGCEIYYVNHSKGTKWTSARGPAGSRRLFHLARFAINWGLFGSVVFVFLGRDGLGIGFWICVAAVVWGAVWSLTFSTAAANQHIKKAIGYAEADEDKHLGYITAQNNRRVEKLQHAVQ